MAPRPAQTKGAETNALRKWSLDPWSILLPRSDEDAPEFVCRLIRSQPRRKPNTTT